MSIGKVGASSGAHFAPLELEGSFTSVAGEVALLMLQNEETQKQLDRESLASAHDAHRQAIDDEVTALREQADAARLGAIVSGTLGMASAGLGVWGALRDCAAPWQSEGAAALDKITQPVGNYVSHNHASAHAAAAQGAGEQASWEVEELNRGIRSSDAVQDKALDWVSQLVADDAAATSAILSNKA